MNLIALAIGGFCGTLLRYGLDHVIPSWPKGFPLGILLINLAGCFSLGWLFTQSRLPLLRLPGVRLGLGTGMLGAFTTFSTFSLHVAQLVQEGRLVAAVVYITFSIVGGLLFSYAGYRLAGRRREGREAE